MILGLIAAIAVFSAIVSLAYWMTAGAASGVDARVKALALGVRPAGSEREEPFRERIIVPLADGVSRMAAAVLPHSFIARTDKRLIAAGRPMKLETFFAFVLVLGLVLPAFLGLALLGRGSSTLLVLVPVVAGLGLLLPFYWLSRKARNRQNAIWKSLPGAYDLITTCVEAGLGLDSAFQRVADKSRGPFSDEITQMLSEVEMGRPRREALEAMAHRTGVPSVLAFVHAVVQAQQLGTNLGRVLRAQSHQMRVQRRQRAEETARRMPIKMVFPLVFCMIPSLFIVTVGPVAITFIRELSN